MADIAKFLSENGEDADFNQYWYSTHTISKIVEDLTETGGRIAFLSTPSIYFSMPESSRAICHVFDYDSKWESDRGFVHYDFNSPEAVPESMKGSFDCVVVDPPFITREVWEKYATTSKMLLKDGGRAVLTTVIENEPLLNELLGAKATAFMPSIPNLVYQYNLFTNYESRVFSQKNPEIPE